MVPSSYSKTDDRKVKFLYTFKRLIESFWIPASAGMTYYEHLQNKRLLMGDRHQRAFHGSDFFVFAPGAGFALCGGGNWIYGGERGRAFCYRQSPKARTDHTVVLGV